VWWTRCQSSLTPKGTAFHGSGVTTFGAWGCRSISTSAVYRLAWEPLTLLLLLAPKRRGRSSERCVFSVKMLHHLSHLQFPRRLWMCMRCEMRIV
jgi:hypothetical protein